MAVTALGPPGSPYAPAALPDVLAAWRGAAPGDALEELDGGQVRADLVLVLAEVLDGALLSEPLLQAAAAAADAGAPLVVLAGRVRAGRREQGAAGITEAREAAGGDLPAAVADLAAAWSRT